MTAAHALAGARRSILASLSRSGIEEETVDAIELENTAACLVRMRQVRALVDALPADLMAQRQRGIGVHPYLGHERELRTELRLHMIALRAMVPGKGSIPARSAITDGLPPIRRRLSMVEGWDAG